MSYATWIAFGFAAAMIGLVYGVFAARHNLFPAQEIVGLKSFVERTAEFDRRWRRDFFEHTQMHVESDCPPDPLVILTGGQSNAGNAVSDPADPDPDAEAYMVFSSKCYRLADPLLGPTGNRGSIWAKLGQKLSKEVERPVVFINTAVTATTYDDWLNLKSGYAKRLERALADAKAINIVPDLVLWHQGESDAHKQVDRASFEQKLKPLVSYLFDLLEKPNAKIILYRASICNRGRESGNPELIAAQSAIAEHNPRLILGPNTDKLGPRDRYDGCHFNGRGRDKIVDASLPMILETLGTQ